jgi:hypothetical protein
MTASLVAAHSESADVLAAYADHIAALPIGENSRHARRLAARRFLEHHFDLDAWLDRPTPARMVDLHRDKAWPFVVWAAVSGRLRVDVELLLAKPGGVDLSVVWDASTPARSSGLRRWATSSAGAPTGCARSLATACPCCARGLARVSTSSAMLT